MAFLSLSSSLRFFHQKLITIDKFLSQFDLFFFSFCFLVGIVLGLRFFLAALYIHILDMLIAVINHLFIFRTIFVKHLFSVKHHLVKDDISLLNMETFPYHIVYFFLTFLCVNVSLYISIIIKMAIYLSSSSWIVMPW